jgi:hypothetical protein
MLVKIACLADVTQDKLWAHSDLPAVLHAAMMDGMQLGQGRSNE